jgi:hypothetical protein
MNRALRQLRTLGIVVSLGMGFAAASCGGDSKDETPPPANGGAPSELEPIQCGADTCEGVDVPISGYAPLEPCCAEGDKCGLDSSFLSAFGIMFSEACQPKHQPGVPGQGCPDSAKPTFAGSTVDIPAFPGCCRLESHTCGYVLDSLLGTFIKADLGCVDSTPFLDGGTAQDCDPGNGSAGAGP